MTLKGRMNSKIYVVFKKLLSLSYTNAVTKLVADRIIGGIVFEMEPFTGTKIDDDDDQYCRY